MFRSEELVININQTPPAGWHYVISVGVDSGAVNLFSGRASYTKTDKPRIVFFAPGKLERLKIYADWSLESD